MHNNSVCIAKFSLLVCAVYDIVALCRSRICYNYDYTLYTVTEGVRLEKHGHKNVTITHLLSVLGRYSTYF